MVAGPRAPPRGAPAEAARRGLTAAVRFLGSFPTTEIGDLYRFADVVCCPSIGTLESSATALEEAAMCGTPVVGLRPPRGLRDDPPRRRRGVSSCRPAKTPTRSPARSGGSWRQARPKGRRRCRTWDDVARDYERLFAELGARGGRPT